MPLDRHAARARRRRGFMTFLTVGVAVLALAWGAKAVALPNDSASDLLTSLFLGDDTEYASGYTESGWTEVRAGMPEHVVRALLGDPLDDASVQVGPYGPRVARLVRYSRERSEGDDAGGHWTRHVAYDTDDLVLHKTGHYLVD